MEGHYGYRRILKELWPMVLMLMVTSVYSIVDGWFISNYAGSTAYFFKIFNFVESNDWDNSDSFW